VFVAKTGNTAKLYPTSFIIIPDDERAAILLVRMWSRRVVDE